MNTTAILRDPRLGTTAARRSVFGLEAQDLLICAAHAPLAVLLRAVPATVTFYSLAVLALGLYWAISPATRHRTLLTAAYIGGSEVLWRMSGGAPVYEFAKYAITLLLLVYYLAARPPQPDAMGRLGLVGFLLLLPSVALTIGALGPSAARDEISFNLSGPLTLGVAVFVFRAVDPASLSLRRVLVLILAPIVGIGALAGRATLAAERIQFTTESNFVTSGGFGPNQVSALLGLGAVVAVLLALHTRWSIYRLAFIGLGGLLLVQAILTFSRGGVLNALSCLAILGLHSARDRRLRALFAAIAVVGMVLAIELVVPALDRFTGGALAARYGDVDPGQRRRLAEAELELFRENPVMGVGPGVAKARRSRSYGRPVAAHTEYTRTLAEHGLLGAASLAILLGLAAAAYLKAPTALGKAWVGIMTGWPLLEMTHAAMRVSIISLAFGLAMLPWARAPRAGDGTARSGT